MFKEINKVIKSKSLDIIKIRINLREFKNNFKDLIYSVIFIGLKDYKIITYTNSTCIIDITPTEKINGTIILIH